MRLHHTCFLNVIFWPSNSTKVILWSLHGCSSTASPKIFGVQIFWLRASNSILFGLHLPKRKMKRYFRNLGGHALPGHTYVCMLANSFLWCWMRFGRHLVPKTYKRPLLYKYYFHISDVVNTVTSDTWLRQWDHEFVTSLRPRLTTRKFFILAKFIL